MLFASLINHLAVQQIWEPHGNLISYGKGEEEERAVGEKELRVAGPLYFILPFFPPSGAAEQGVWGLNGKAFCVCVCVCCVKLGNMPLWL